ncbi:23S rRNA (guanosine(2251)-2'-O)-methyltransferase RlmB [Sphingomicrobium sediminis]|uniref:23S rRNA (Guanosine(2251)-2'-O)-methyltransferase RlmB n=1 Tax=Sphingomicrobium sediminis TaxID=2950949 RepID=A0A9X2J3T7_9SPHN|nr:23S rRNA (guanosine(2251)-2'-O)-methyltransferase RlmB [Sphingomicrobium sediminis]MCM8557666.1 23S rRNA (guanosine(2251)-2'-O)-methyltransferase RlmB [Sphingomicrobium sediminis]
MARKRKGKRGDNPNRPRFWGKHAVAAALDNPDRTVLKAWTTQEMANYMNFPSEVQVVRAEVTDLARLVPHDAPHQGVVIECEPLEDIWLGDVLAEADEKSTILVLDQVTDPHNVGAILRSAAAFDVAAIVTQDRHAPPEGGALAKAASGALETVPWVRVVNLARALDEMAEAGFWRIGLAGEADTTLAEALGPKRVALVLGAEGPGMRANVRDHCDALAKLPISERMESLNVSNAAAISLYAASIAGRGA